MEKIPQIAQYCTAIGLAGILAIGLISRNEKKKETNGREARTECSALVSNCLAKAAGKDRVMTFDEQVKLARGLGYKGLLYSGEDIRLFDSGVFTDGEPLARLNVLQGGTYKEKMSVSREAMRAYLGKAEED